VEDVKQAVIAGYEAYLAAFSACLAAPSACEPSGFTMPGSPAEAGAAQSAEFLQANGYRSEANPAVDFFAVESVALDNGEAELTVCRVDGGTTYDTRGTDDPGDDVVVNNEVRSIRTTWKLERFETNWRVRAGAKLTDEAGITCARP
jgi:hypothetical protein